MAAGDFGTAVAQAVKGRVRLVRSTGMVAVDTANIQAAIDAGGTVTLAALDPLSPVIVVNPLQIKTGSILDLGGCILRLADGANADLITVPQFATLTGSGSAGGEHDFVIRNGALDGNRSGNASGFGCRLYGRRFTLQSLDIFNAADDGLYTEWAFAGAGDDGMEAHFLALKIYGNGRWGWRCRGPHDSTAHQVIIYNNNAVGDSSSGGLWVENDTTNPTPKWLAGALQLTDSHIWGTSHRWALIAEGSTFVANTQIEGASVGQVLALAPVIMRGGKIFNLTNNGRVPNIGIQIGDDGETSGYARTRAWTVGRCDIDTRLQGFYGSSRASAPVAWVAGNQSRLSLDVDMAIQPVTSAIDAGAVGLQVGGITTLTLADASLMPLAGRVSVPTSGGSQTLSYSGVAGNTLTGVALESGSASNVVSAGVATLVTATVVGAYDRQSNLSIRGTHGSATAAERAAWSVLTRVGIYRWYGGASGATKTFEVDSSTGHLTASNAPAALSVAPHANAGTGATAGISGATDMRGQVSITAGSASITSGTAATVTLASPYVDSNPTVIASPASSATAALRPYATSTGKGTFLIGFQTAPSPGQTYYVNFVTIG